MRPAPGAARQRDTSCPWPSPATPRPTRSWSRSGSTTAVWPLVGFHLVRAPILRHRQRALVLPDVVGRYHDCLARGDLRRDRPAVRAVRRPARSGWLGGDATAGRHRCCVSSKCSSRTAAGSGSRVARSRTRALLCARMRRHDAGRSRPSRTRRRRPCTTAPTPASSPRCGCTMTSRTLSTRTSEGRRRA